MVSIKNPLRHFKQTDPIMSLSGLKAVSRALFEG